MARFFGNVGYGKAEESAPGVWKDVIVVKQYYGDVLRASRLLEDGDKVNNDLSVGNTISIVADAYAGEHFFTMKYVEWAGTRWLIERVDVSPPRMLLRLGGVYNGPTA